MTLTRKARYKIQTPFGNETWWQYRGITPSWQYHEYQRLIFSIQNKNPITRKLFAKVNSDQATRKSTGLRMQAFNQFVKWWMKIKIWTFIHSFSRINYTCDFDSMLWPSCRVASTAASTESTAPSTSIARTSERTSAASRKFYSELVTVVVIPVPIKQRSVDDDL